MRNSEDKSQSSWSDHRREIRTAKIRTEELAGAMAEELVDANLDLEGGVAVALVKGEIVGADEGDGFVGAFGAEDVAEGDVLEADLLADVVVVGDVDAGWDAGAREREDLERGEIRGTEFVFLKVFGPGELRDRLRGGFDELLEGEGTLFVDHRDHAFPFPPDAGGVPISLNEADVGFHFWAL